MSFNINSDKEFIRGSKPQLIGDNELTIRTGSGSLEKEIIRTQLDANTGLPRVGINRTGQRVNEVKLISGGSAYTSIPSVTLDPPGTAGGIQALASAFIFNGEVINVAVNNPGSGYTSAPAVTITGGGGSGASGESFLDTVDFELDINGAIRTSTSIISDTARVLNLDVDNFVTPDLVLRGPNFKNYMNGTGILWDSNVIVQENAYRWFGSNVYQALNTGTTASTAPVHTDGIVTNGTVQFKHIGIRSEDQNAFAYGETGEAGIFPRSITPLLGDRSDKIATTEYVLNLATNDVGGRIYVSEQIGSDLNDGRSAVNPVRTIKKAAQEAWKTVGVKETIIVSGGEYLEDNPISLPPDASVVGDNLRLVIVRPKNPGKHIFKFGDKNYVTGVTYRDKVDANGDSVSTWDFAMVFDDKQRVILDYEVNGDFGVEFPVGHQIFGPDQFRIGFQENTGLSALQTGLEIVGINTGARAKIFDLTFTGTGVLENKGTIDITLTSGSIQEGETFKYITSASTNAAINAFSISAVSGFNTFRTTTDPTGEISGGDYIFLDDLDDSTFTSGYYEVASITPDDENTPTYWDVTVVPILNSPAWNANTSESILIYEASVVEYQFDGVSLESIRAEGEVVSVDEDVTNTLPIQRLDFSLQGDPSITTGGFQDEQFGNAEDLGGVVFYTNELVGRENFHEFKEGQEILIEGLPTVGPDLSFLNGKQRIYKVLEDADGRCRRFVIPKKASSINDANFDPGQNATVSTYSRSVTLSLLNSPNTFALTTPVERRFQDACVFIRNNRDFIADEVVGRINDEFKKDHYSVYDIGGQSTAQFTPTDVTYDTATGDAVFTVNNHGLSLGDGIRIADQSIVFTCTMDNNQTEHALPDTDQYASGRSLPITASTTNTFTVNVGASGPDQQFTPSGANYDPSTGDLVLTVGPHTLSAGEGIIIDDNSLSFTCDMDGNQSVKTYPRPGIDPFAGRSMPITSVAENTITINAGISGPNKYFTPTGANYNPSTGDMTVTVGQHGLGVGRSVVLADSSLTFTCALDNNATQHSYPRPGTDPYAGQKSIEITAVGSTQHTATDAPYDAATGVVTLTVAGHGFTNGDYVKIDDGSLTYTCDLDGNTVQKAYPRAGYDYPSGRWLEISNVTTNTFDINVGSSSYTGTHTFVSAAANGIDRQDGTFTINVGISSDTSVHTFISATTNAIKHEPQSIHSFSGSTSNAVKHLPQSGHTFVRSATNSISVGGSSFSIYLGTLDHVNTWISGGTVTATSNGAVANVTNFVYDTANTGVAVVTTDTPLTLANDDIVRLADLLIECEAGQKIYPAYSSPTSTNSGTNGDVQCRQDVVHFCNALVRDLEFGTNHNIIESSQKYIVDGKIAYIEDEITQNVRAIEYARELAVYAMRNWRTKNGTPNDPIYTPRYSSITRYFDDTVITSTATDGGTIACEDVRSAIDTLSYLWVDVITNGQNGTYKDAAYLITRNADVIASETYYQTKVAYPGLNHNNIDERKCLRDTKSVLNALVKDLTLGGNFGILEAGEIYFTGTALTGVAIGELPAVRYAYTVAKDLAQKAMRNWSTSGNIIAAQPTNATYNSTSGELVLTVITSNLPSGFSSAANCRVGFQLGALTFNCAHNSGGDDASPQILDTNPGQSYPVLGYSEGGGISTITLNVGAAGTNTDAHTFVSALSGGTIFVNDYAVLNTTIPRFEDYTTGTDFPNTPICAGVKSAIDTSFQLLDDILSYAVDPVNGIEPGTTTPTYGTLFTISDIITYPNNYVYDLNNTRMAIRGTYDDYPIIEASPYTQNASVISFLGGGGAEVDGNKVKQPNCPFPGLNQDGTAQFPNQGKSMVAAAFTIVSFGGTGYRVINDGYVQLVSVFVIFCADGVLAESGGYASITNSATNFGVHALRGIGFREEAYSFDVATITNVSSTPTGRAILTVDGLGREPLEHYIVKIDGYQNTNEDIEYFVDVVAKVGAGPPFSAELTIDDGQGQAMNLTDSATGVPVATSVLDGKTIRLHRPSIVNSSSHTWEYAGSGTNYLALPENGGTKNEAEEQVSENYGRVYVSGTDELGDFKVGTFARIENRTGNITFTGTVTISEVEFLKLKGGDVVVTGFSADNTLGGATTSNSVLPTQKAVRDYITNNLGPFINKPYSTNAVPRALVELTDSGKISVDQIPALRPFEVFTVVNEAERLQLEGALAGDIAIQQNSDVVNGSPQSFILNNDLDSQFLAFNPDPTIQFTLNDIFQGSNTTGRVQATEYRTGVVFTINLVQGGSGYTVPPTVTIAGTVGQGGIEAKAETTIANGEVVTISLIFFNGVKGGKGYTSAPTVTISAPPGLGTQATANALIESRLYGNIVNRIAIIDTDQIESSDVPAVTVNLTRVVNTSSSDITNWVGLSSNQIAASDITSGTIETDRLANSGAANSFTFLRGDSSFALAVQSLKGAETRYFAKLYSNVSSGQNSMIFTTNSEFLIGHSVLSSINGIQANTNITGVITAAGLTTISINNPVSQTITAGTIIEFQRGNSPMIFESTYTQGNFVDRIIIANGGTGFTNGQYSDIALSGGAGTDLKASITVSGNTITKALVTSGGINYTSDFTITLNPTEIGAGSGMVLEAKVSTVNRQYANVALDVQRVTDLTITADEYGTIGVSRFRKAQFNLGTKGNGSVELKTGAGSGLDADKLDDKQGSYYTNATNLFTGTVPTDRLAGSYNINVSGSSGNTLRLATGTNNPTSNPTPNNFVEGLAANTINNSSDGLNDGGAQHLVLTIRNKGQGLTAEGGVRQMAFTDNDNIWLRGSGDEVTTFGTWAKMWTSLNDGPGSGLDADRLSNKQAEWYQNALNINYGVISDNRIPTFLSATKFRDNLRIQSFNGDPKFKIYVAGQILNATPFTPGGNVNIYNALSQAIGAISIDNIVINDDASDTFNDYTILIGRLTAGNFIGGETIGTASNRVPYQDFTLDDNNVVEVATLESDGGTANLRLGRKDGNATSPGVYFNSSQLTANYNSAIVSTGGTSTDGSGTLNAIVVNADGFNINGNVIWNEGNIQFNSSNVVSTAVERDASGNFAASTITASLIGASSLNVLKTGDTMTGPLQLSGVNSTLTIAGAATFSSTVGITDDLTVDGGVLFVDASSNEVGINTTDPQQALHVYGNIRLDAVNPEIQFNGTSDTGIDIAIKATPEGLDFYEPEDSNKIQFRIYDDTGVDSPFGYHINGTRIFNQARDLTNVNSTTIQNTGAGQLNFYNNSGTRYWRAGSNNNTTNFFTIEASDANGGTSFSGAPALAISGVNNAVTINTTTTSGTDPSDGTTVRNYKFNVQGDMNLNGQFFQNNAEFVTSRWTEATNGNDIYRLSSVGINKADPQYTLDLDGDFNITGIQYINGNAQWLDSNGIIKIVQNADIAENITIGNSSDCFSNGPIVIATGYAVTIGSGSSWAII